MLEDRVVSVRGGWRIAQLLDVLPARILNIVSDTGHVERNASKEEA
jgi:hypothetical protein